jgi:putative ATP-binding cassette transporter
MLYVPRGAPYLPRGTLREILAYPGEAADYDDARFAAALDCVGLARLSGALDEAQRWDRELSQDEQLSIAFARIVLQRPPWVLIDDAFAAVDDDGRMRLAGIFRDLLPTTAVIHIGRAGPALDPLFTRVVQLVRLAPAASDATTGERA